MSYFIIKPVYDDGILVEMSIVVHPAYEKLVDEDDLDAIFGSTQVKRGKTYSSRFRAGIDWRIVNEAAENYFLKKAKGEN